MSEKSKEDKVNDNFNGAPAANGLGASSSEKAQYWTDSNSLEGVVNEDENSEEPEDLYQGGGQIGLSGRWVGMCCNWSLLSGIRVFLLATSVSVSTSTNLRNLDKGSLQNWFGFD